MKPAVSSKSKETPPTYRVRVRAGRLTLPKELLNETDLTREATFVVQLTKRGYLLQPEKAASKSKKEWDFYGDEELRRADDPGDITPEDIVRGSTPPQHARASKLAEIQRANYEAMRRQGLTLKDLLKDLDKIKTEVTREIYGPDA